MPHVTFVSLTGFRVREGELAALGVTLPGLAARAGAVGALPPLGLLTLAGMTPHHWSASLHEASACDDDLVQRVVMDQPTIVAISAVTASINEAYCLADQLRTERVKIVIGGLHVTTCPDEAGGHADAIVVGEGEPTWPDVLADAEADRLQSEYRAEHPFDLACAPLPRFGLLGSRARPRFTVQASRGCPYACDFCAASRLLGPVRRKPANRLRAELDAICRIHANPTIELADDNTFAGKAPHDDLLDVLASSGSRWFTEADWRLGEDNAVLTRLADAGCVQVLVGLESLVHRHRGMGPKQASMGRMMEAVEAIQSVGVAVIGCFIAGSDGETRASLDRLGAFIETAPCADVQVTLQTPFPGTVLRKRLQREGRILQDRDWSHYTLFDVTYQPDTMGADELQRSFHELLASVFAPGPSHRRGRIRRDVWRRHPRFRG